MSLIEQRLWNVALLGFAFLELLIACLLAYVAFQSSTSQELRKPEVEYSLGTFGNAFGGLRGLDKSVSVHGEELDNLYASNSKLENVGTAPILPTDFYGKVIVQVDAPWRIIEVSNQDFGVALNWSRASDTEYVAEPTLLNPGDESHFKVYVTNDAVARPSSDNIKDINLRVSARIADVSKLKDAREAFFEMSEHARQSRDLQGPFIVVMDTWEILATLAVTTAYLAMYLRLMTLTGILTGLHNWASLASICGATLASMAAAESTIDVLFPAAYALELVDVYFAAPQSLVGRFGAKHWANYAILLLHFGALVMLLLRVRKRGPVLAL